ncbi:DUF3784 domain-containing protein [Sediminitomix flava]|uniref:Uncharacterized protein DUF3784 n=1 Tax=Sediminitomix flava TaxID=379075 RepID=A0A315ZCS5_SEDFL|nr:DUF3784 domain-containing protein [Sediminitomix flava]PWJ43092.1 uncharacterized protein DUF3784 [Sediminitomix flava]
MIYLIVFISLLFLGIGSLINESNAKYLLSGYNTMSEEERKNFDLKAFLPFFKGFHHFLGISFLALSIGLYFISEEALGLFLAVYPILCYIYFILKSHQKFSNSLKTPWYQISIVVLVITLATVTTLFAFGLKEDHIVIKPNQIIVEGFYGEELQNDEIASISLIDDLPNITLRANGFSIGEIDKGYYKTEDGEKVKLVINKVRKPILLITKTNGEKIYFSAKTDNNQTVLRKIKKLSTKF